MLYSTLISLLLLGVSTTEARPPTLVQLSRREHETCYSETDIWCCTKNKPLNSLTDCYTDDDEDWVKRRCSSWVEWYLVCCTEDEDEVSSPTIA
ncbi:hypothetical protein EJ05DRAFT_474217 [Pseudovirgaria hyperparasitica]|uniref:Uncharacterized protein n=1 Tax=Pseudovirgaria hyperparasitica TaxID=470096 RepID=A0A6A6WEL8_9PEZI|nr:uncharacterized protein EJ05DRAFT_474217 [Pseudovirgaria hyperparasitica]KAF2760326.1 hypothetical protein EJ05DRAFT_474217 [Pseudovirgaria hyperparasitica]